MGARGRLRDPHHHGRAAPGQEGPRPRGPPAKRARLTTNDARPDRILMPHQILLQIWSRRSRTRRTRGSA